MKAKEAFYARAKLWINNAPFVVEVLIYNTGYVTKNKPFRKTASGIKNIWIN